MSDTELGHVGDWTLARAHDGSYMLRLPRLEFVLTDAEWRSLVSLARLWFAEENSHG